MKNFIIVLMIAMMLLALDGCAGNAIPYTANSSLPEIETGSVSVGTSRGNTDTATTEPSDQASEVSVVTSDSPLRQVTPSTAQQNNTSRESNSRPSAAKSSETPITLSLDKSTINLNIGEKVTIKATVNPNGTAVSWSSGDDGIASVENGNVTGVSAGATVIIASAGEQKQRCTVIVKTTFVQMDPQPYIDYAIRYGESLGLKHDETHVSKVNWNPWVNLYSALGEETMKQNIRNALETLVDEGRKYFFIYCEPQTDKSYRLYIFFG